MVVKILRSVNKLTLAKYGEGAALSTHKDRYTERFSEFMLNGGIRRLQRHGLKADGNYGKIDNLHISYNGNRITTVLEDADPVTQSGSMDYPGAKREMRFGYNDWGALVSDESRGIEAIEYDSFGNPVHIKFSGRDYTKNVYSATGVKLATEHYTHPLQTGPIVIGDEAQQDMEAASTQLLPGIISPEHHLLAGQQKIEYRGPVIYRNFKIDMVLFPGGYATIGNDNAVTFHYYTQDYLGNNRAVVNGSTGAVEQMTAYYPYGAVIPDLGTGNSGQPFKFGGKELVSANGLNAFDFGARLHYPAIPQFDRIDPMAEKYAWLSPYLYCANNPVNLIDPSGMFIVEASQELWEMNKNRIISERDRVKSDIERKINKGEKKGWSSDKLAKQIGDKSDRLSSLNNTLETMSTLEASTQGYSLSETSGELGGVTLTNGNIIDISYAGDDTANFVHEVTHAGQFESGDIAFKSNSGKTMLVDVFDEISAYQAQYAYDPSSVAKINPNHSIDGMQSINAQWVTSIRIGGVNIYGANSANMTGQAILNLNTPVSNFIQAFPGNSSAIHLAKTYNSIRDIPNLYYKR